MPDYPSTRTTARHFEDTLDLDKLHTTNCTMTPSSDSSAVIDDYNGTNNNTNDMSINSSSSHQQQPVLIPIKLPQSNKNDSNENDTNNQHTINEWAMIEINGELFVPPSATTNKTTNNTTTIFDITNRIELGSISFIDSNDHTSKIPIMILGTHELRGTIVELVQPFLCLQKQHHQSSLASSVVHDNFNTGNHNNNIETTTTTTSFDIMGVVKYKLVFNQYPKTIMR
jgi:Ctf8